MNSLSSARTVTSVASALFTPVIENSSRPVRPSDVGVLAVRVLEREDAHHQQVRAVDPLVALRDHGADAEQLRALRRPVARRAACRTPCRRARSAACPRRGTAPRRRRSSLPRRTGRAPSTCPPMPGTSRLRSRTFANVPRTITSWLPRRDPYELNARALDAVVDEVLPGRAVGLDRAGRRDVVGRDRVAEHDEAARAGDVVDARRLERHALEVGRPAHVGRGRRPTRRGRRPARRRARQVSSPVKTSA